MDKEEALAICFANLKGARSKDLIRTAEALAFLKALPEFKSNKAVGSVVGVSGEIVREFVGLLTLPIEIKDLLAAGVLRLEHGRRLTQLARRRPEIVQEAAEAMSGLTAMDARSFVEFLLKYPEMPLADVTRAIVESHATTEREYHVIALLSEANYRRLSEIAKAQGRPVDYLVTSILQDWLAEGQIP